MEGTLSGSVSLRGSGSGVYRSLTGLTAAGAIEIVSIARCFSWLSAVLKGRHGSLRYYFALLLVKAVLSSPICMPTRTDGVGLLQSGFRVCGHAGSPGLATRPGFHMK